MSKVFYTGEGVLHHDGKDYGFGKVLPGDLPAETVASMIKKGKASMTAPTGPSETTDETTALREQVQKLSGELAREKEMAGKIGRDLVAERDAARAELATVTGERDAARDSLEQAQNTIKEMSAAQLNAVVTPPAPPAPPQQHAGPKK